ncbi:MAG: T9SS type A sorting domain-containing protein [Caldithrix sp.]|nr:T9SS type A sorting domain-containing protein [Caldithrix sp.]
MFSSPNGISLWLIGLLFTFFNQSTAQQITIDRVESMPDEPAPYQMRDWAQVARDYDAYVFDFSKQDSNGWLPLIGIQENGVNYPGLQQFWLHTVVGTNAPTNGEAINVLPAVIGASLVGIDKSNQNGKNWVVLCQQWFNRRSEENIYLNNFSGSSGNDWWYDTMPNVFFYQLYDLYPGTGDFEYQFTTVADRWLAAVRAMGGSAVPWQIPYMNYRGWYFSTMTANTDSPAEPEAAGAIAWLLYNAYLQTGLERYRIGAEWSMEFLNEWDSNPSYELQLPYGVYIAARMNAELGTQYDVRKLLNWCFTPQGNVRQWGVTLGRWGNYDCYGLVGEALNDGYAFLMNGLEMAGALVPMVRYDDRFAQTIGKWVLNLANASRLFYTAYLPDDHQDSEAWSYQYDPQSLIAHESMRENWYGKSPYATGDAVSGGWGETNLALYGSSHVGILGGIIDTTEVPMILQLDLLTTDYFQDEAYPSYLYFNPYDIDKTVTLDAGNGTYDIYDAVQNDLVQTGVSGTTSLTIPSNSAVLAVICPADGRWEYHLNKRTVNGIVVDYHTEMQVDNYPPRIKILAATDSSITLNDTTVVHCTADDIDGNALQYEWQSDAGTILGQGKQIQWIAPSGSGNYSISCQVADNNGGLDSSTIAVNVVEAINHAPVINNMEASSRKLDIGTTTQLTCQAEDVDGDSLEYTWQATDGLITDSADTAEWKAPVVQGTYHIKCTVEDGNGGAANQDIAVLVRDFSQYTKGQLIAYYPLDGNANDVSGNGHNGQINEAQPVEGYDSISNHAYAFDGANDHIRISNHSELNFTEAITINLWIKIPAYFDDEAFVISHGSWEERWKMSFTEKPHNRLRWTVNTSEGIYDVDTDFQLQTNRWYNVTAFYDGQDFEIYIDGRLNNFAEQTGPMNTTTKDLMIAQRFPDDYQYNFKGAVDEIRIYENGISPTEIHALYEQMTPLQQYQNPTLPEQHVLKQNHPNPFNNSTTITFNLASKSPVTVEIFSVHGQHIRTIVEKVLPAGEHSARWNAQNLASGIYFYRLRSRSFTSTKKMILIR